jgi:hypothetical protein
MTARLGDGRSCRVWHLMSLVRTLFQIRGVGNFVIMKVLRIKAKSAGERLCRRSRFGLRPKFLFSVLPSIYRPDFSASITFHNLDRGVGPPGFSGPRIGEGACAQASLLSQRL